MPDNPALSGAQMITLLVVSIIAIVLIPILIEQVTGVNTTLWNFTGASGAGTLWDLIPFVWVAGLIVATVLVFLGRR